MLATACLNEIEIVELSASIAHIRNTLVDWWKRCYYRPEVSKQSKPHQRTSKMAEMCPAPLQLRVGATVILDGRTSGVCETRTTRHWRQRNVRVAAVPRHHRRRRGRRGGLDSGRGLGRRSPCRPSTLPGTARTARQRLGRRRRQKDTGQSRHVAMMSRWHRHRLRAVQLHWPYSTDLLSRYIS